LYDTVKCMFLIPLKLYPIFGTALKYQCVFEFIHLKQM